MPLKLHAGNGLELAPQARARDRAHARASAARLLRARARPPRRSPRSGASAACRSAVRARGRRRTGSARSSAARPRARTARRCPSVRRTCARSATGNRRRAVARRRAACPPPATHRCARARRARDTTAAMRGDVVDARRSRCWPASATPAACRRAAPSRTASARHPAAVVGLDQRDGETLLLELLAARRAPTCARCARSRCGRGRAGARSAARATPSSARLLASVAPEVKMISRGVGADQRRDLARAPPRRVRCAAGPGRAWPTPDCPASPDRVRHSAIGRGDARIHRRGRGVVEVDSHGLSPGALARRAAPLALHRGEDAAQDVDLVLVHLAALEQAADARHEVRAAAACDRGNPPRP